MAVECVADVRAKTGECPVWDAIGQVLWWTDIPNCRLYRYDPASGENRAFDLPSPCGAFAVAGQGDLLLALKTGLHRFDPATGAPAFLRPPPFGHPNDRFNDGRTDPAGRFWVCSMRDPQDPEARAGEFYRIDPDLRVSTMITGLIVGNGLAFSPDGQILYMSDSHPRVQTIWAWDYDPAGGTIRNQRVFARLDDSLGRPDGAAVDQDGCYWTAANGGWQLIRYTPAGRIDRKVRLPVARPTMLAFGGRELDTVFVTSQTPRAGETPEGQPQAGGLFALALGVKGLPEPRFGG